MTAGSTAAKRRLRVDVPLLRHVFATGALAQPGARIEDVSRLLGQVRVTQDLYIAPDADLCDRFYEATG